VDQYSRACRALAVAASLVLGASAAWADPVIGSNILVNPGFETNDATTSPPPPFRGLHHDARTPLDLRLLVRPPVMRYSMVAHLYGAAGMGAWSDEWLWLRSPQVWRESERGGACHPDPNVVVFSVGRWARRCRVRPSVRGRSSTPTSLRTPVSRATITRCGTPCGQNTPPKRKSCLQLALNPTDRCPSGPIDNPRRSSILSHCPTPTSVHGVTDDLMMGKPRKASASGAGGLLSTSGNKPPAHVRNFNAGRQFRFGGVF